MGEKINIDHFDVTDTKQLEKLAQTIIDNMKEGMTLQQATGITDTTLEEIYSLAYGYYNMGKHKESVSLFQFLSSVSPSNYKYVLGLAASYHQMELFQDAAVGFYIALNIEENNPIPAYYLIDCLHKLHFEEEAKEIADYALELCKNNPEYKEIQNRIKLIKNSFVN